MKKRILVGGAVVVVFVVLVAFCTLGSWGLLRLVAPHSLLRNYELAVQEVEDSQIIPLGNPLNIITSVNTEEGPFREYITLHNRVR